MNGYIIKSGRKLYLSKKLFWFAHDSNFDAWVHPKSILETLNCEDWQIKPTTAIPAKVENGRTIVTGKAFKI